MRALVFGDSHSACLIEAWRAGGWPEGREMAFFVRSAGRAAEHEIADGRIAATSEAFRQFLSRLDQAAEQDLAAQDAFVIVGSGVSLFHVVQVLNLYRVLEWDGTGERDGRPVLSEAVLRIAVSEALLASPAGRLMAQLRAVPGLEARPIHLLPQPFPSERALKDTTAPAGAGLRRMVRRGVAARAVGLFLEETERFALQFGAVLHRQPEETVARDCFTALAYMTAARRLVNLAMPQPKTDILHANQAYGRLMLEKVLA